MRNVICDIGYTSSDVGYDGETCGVINIIGKQFIDIAQGVDRSRPEDQARDQGLMFGYASNETDVLMPAPITFSHRLVERQAEARKSGPLPMAASRCQVSGDLPLRKRQAGRYRCCCSVHSAQPGRVSG